MESRIYTAKAKKWRSFMLGQRDIDIWNAAAAREEISKSEFLRRALRERASKVLLSEAETTPQ